MAFQVVDANGRLKVQGTDIGSGVTGGTTGSVLFIGASSVLAQDNANFFWNDTANHLLVRSTTDVEGLILTNASQTPILRLNTENANAAARNWAVLTNFDAFGDFNIRRGASQGADALAGTTLFRMLTTGAFTFVGQGSITSTTEPTLLIQTNLTNATIKNSAIAMTHYTNAEEPVGILLADSTSLVSVLNFGGGAASQNAATQISFWTAATTTTPTGTERMRIDTGGLVGIGTTPAATLDVGGSFRTLTAAQSTNYTLTLTDSTIYATTGVGGITTTLPAASATTIGLYYFVYKVDTGIGLLTIAAAGSDTINGAASKTIANQWNGVLIRGFTATSWIATSFTGL